MALHDTEVIRLDALICCGANPVNTYEQRVLDILAGTVRPESLHELRWTAVALDIHHSWWADQASMLDQEMSRAAHTQGAEPLTDDDDFPPDDWTKEEIEAMNHSPSMTERLRCAEREEARAATRCRTFAERHGSEGWYAEAMECTSVPGTDEEVNDGVSREFISLRSPLVPKPPAAPTTPQRPRDPEDDVPI